jgi:hypothetical protein
MTASVYLAEDCSMKKEQAGQNRKLVLHRETFEMLAPSMLRQTPGGISYVSVCDPRGNGATCTPVGPI